MGHGFEGRDTMFSVREVPWHRLGTVVETAPTAKEAIRLAGLDWRVSKEPLICCEKVVKDRFGLVRDVDSECLGICGEWYNIVQNCEAFDFLENLVGEELRYETAGSIFNGKKVFITTKFKEQWRIADDDVELYLLISNGHTGQDALKVAVTPVRVVCNNTLQAGFGQARRLWSMVHSDNISSKMQEAQRTLRLTENYMKSFVEIGNKSSEIPVSTGRFEELMDILFPKPSDECKTKRGWTIRENKMNALWSCYNAEDIRQYHGTAWGIMNAVADYESHYRTKNLEVTMGHALNGDMKMLQKTVQFLGL